MLKVNAFFFCSLLAMNEILLKNSRRDLNYYYSVYFCRICTYVPNSF